jgi:hypothetical protein
VAGLVCRVATRVSIPVGNWAVFPTETRATAESELAGKDCTEIRPLASLGGLVGAPVARRLGVSRRAAARWAAEVGMTACRVREGLPHIFGARVAQVCKYGPRLTDRRRRSIDLMATSS